MSDDSETAASPSLVSASTSGAVPQPDDVLFGRGKGIQNHGGNVRFREIVDRYADSYEASSRTEKAKIAEKIVEIVKGSNGRFLKRRHDDEWEEVDDRTARRKVAHLFRNRRKAGDEIG